ncbi:MAG: chemotaxis protein CheW [Prochlorothrix sp.]
MTLVDISGILNLPLTRSEQGNKAIVARLDQLVAGITVDSVFDVVYLRPADISPIPAAVHSLNDEYIRGVAPYQEQQMSILDLPKLLLSPELVVEESV